MLTGPAAACRFALALSFHRQKQRGRLICSTLIDKLAPAGLALLTN